jgi:chloride channel protein, CIC family
MIDTQVRPKSYARLMVLVAIRGVASAVVTFVFMVLVNKGTGLIWQQAQLAVGLDSRLFTLLVCALGGLLVGLLVKIFGDHNAIFFELVQEFGRTGRFDYSHAPGIVITSIVSLVAGGSLGPEAALADACGSIGTWISDRRKLGDKETRTMGYGGLSAMLAAFITNPFAGALLALESSQGGMTGAQVHAWGLLPSLLASAGATVVFVALAGGFFETLYAFPDYTPRLIDLVLAVPFSLAGGLAGLFFMLLLRWLRKVMQPLKGRLVLRGLIGGLGMGIIGALLPLTLFSGEAETSELIQQATQIGFLMLILLGASKLVATSLLLATGWKGGYIFPIMFAGVALGMAGHLLFPATPIAVTVAATLAGALVAALRAPLFAALFTLAMVQAETAPVVAVSVLVGSLMTTLLGQRMTRRAQAKAQSADDQAQSQRPPQELHEAESAERAKNGGPR